MAEERAPLFTAFAPVFGIVAGAVLGLIVFVAIHEIYSWYGWPPSVAAQLLLVGRLVNEYSYVFLLLCPMSLAQAEIPHIHVWTDIAWIYFEVVASNTLIYFVLGSVVSFWVNTMRRAIANRPQPR